MKLARLIDAGESGTKLGKFLGALMRGFKPEEFMMVIGRLDYNLVLYAKEGWSDARRAEFLKHYAELARICDEAGLGTTANYARTAIEYLARTAADNYAIEHLDEGVRIARRTLYEEMKTLQYFEVPQHQIAYWKDKEPFGSNVSAKFPDAVYDVEQAAKCLALDRPTACVFHLMRVMDFTLSAFSQHVGSTVDPLKNWKPILKGISDQIAKMPETTPSERILKEDYWRIYGHLSAVKNAWRNPTMHPRKHYDTEEAEDVFCATRGFVRDVAKVI